MNIVGVVSLYHPDMSELQKHIEDYKYLNKCFLMDDSEVSNSSNVNELIEECKDVVRYIWNEDNIGLCASLNSGIKRAMKEEAEWILILDQDSDYSKESIHIICDFLQKNNVDNIYALAPQCNYDRHKRKAYCGCRIISWACASGLLINAKLCEKIGLFDERLFLDGLDYEWCMRANKKGYKLIEIGEAVLNHHPAETREIRIGNKTVFLYGWAEVVRYYYRARSNQYVWSKYHRFDAIKWQTIILLKALLLFKNKMQYLKGIVAGIRDAKRNCWGKCTENFK